MKLVIETIKTSMEQEISHISDERSHIGAIIPYLYFHNLQSGVFKFELLSGANVLYEHQFNYLDIKGGKLENYMHVYHPIVPNDPIQLEKGTYTFRISAVSDYEAKPDSFLAWIKQHEDIQLPMQYVPTSDARNTLTIRFKEYKNGVE